MEELNLTDGQTVLSRKTQVFTWANLQFSNDVDQTQTRTRDLDLNIACDQSTIIPLLQRSQHLFYIHLLRHLLRPFRIETSM